MPVPAWAWLVFASLLVASLAADLVAHRGGRSLGRKHALAWSAGWISVAALFAVWIAIQFGRGAATDFTTAYLIEKSLSVDNIFLFVALFARLRIPSAEQHRVLFWGILGAVASRAVFIASGAALLARWHPALYLLGAFLIYTGVKTLRADASDEGEGRVLRSLRKYLPFTPRLHGHRFIAREAGRFVATPLLLALLAIEATDVLFAVDSVPAVFAVTSDPFVVYSSNVLAVLGLRALYLVLATLLEHLKYLRFALAGILGFVGAKMLASGVVVIPQGVSLLAIASMLAAAIVPSIVAALHARHALRTAHSRGL